MKINFTESLKGGLSFDMVFVQGGEFVMGDQLGEGFERERPTHKVKLRPFCIGKYPVTQHLWESLMDDNPSFFRGLKRPVEQVSWQGCQKFVQRLSAQSGKIYRLPTEAEWEYAARGGSKSKGFTYAGGNKLKEVGWYSEISHGETKVVGMKVPNELGLYDMSGNVREWCQDFYDWQYYQQCADLGVIDDPQGSARGSDRVPRGGCWNIDQKCCRVSYRDYWSPWIKSYDIGFRLALSPQGIG